MPRCELCGVGAWHSEPCNVPTCPARDARSGRTSGDGSLAAYSGEQRADGTPIVVGALIAFGITAVSRVVAFLRAPRIDEATDHQADGSDPYLEAMVTEALRIDRRHATDRAAYEMADIGIGFPTHHGSQR